MRIRRTLAIVLAVVMATALFAACGDDSDDGVPGSGTTPPQDAPSSTAGDDEASFPRVIEHALGEVEIAEKPERIVSASVSITGNLLAIDAPVVATGTSSGKLSDSNGFFLQWADIAVERKVAALGGPAVGIEAVAAQKPDLIIGTANGADAIAENYELLSQIAPTIVIDASGASWDEVATLLGEATGHEDGAEAAKKRFDEAVEKTKAALDLPSDRALGMVYNPDGANVFTPVSAHGRLLAEMGFEVVDPSTAGSTSDAEGGNRSDIVPVGLELLPDLIGDASVFLFFADDSTLESIRNVPVLANTPAVQTDRAMALGNDSFRLDYYSATLVVERIGEQLGS